MFGPAPIASDADHVVGPKPFDHTIGEKIVVDPDVVMDEDEQTAPIRRPYACVIDLRKRSRVVERHARNQARGTREPPQGTAECGFLPEVAFRQPRSTDDLDRPGLDRGGIATPQPGKRCARESDRNGRAELLCCSTG